MNGILQQAEEAFRRWKVMNTSEPPPILAVYLRDRDRPLYFTGLALAPVSGAGACAISGLGYALPIHVLRNEDIARVVIGEPGQPPIGFQSKQ